MKISELVEHLNNVKRFYGDLEVRAGVSLPDGFRSLIVGKPIRPQEGTKMVVLSTILPP
jgi:hypothetical protein